MSLADLNDGQEQLKCTNLSKQCEKHKHDISIYSSSQLTCHSLDFSVMK